MSERSKIALGSALSNLLVFVVLFTLQRKEFASADMLAQSWGMFFLKFLAGMVILNVLVTAAFTLASKAKGGKGFDEPVDERDAFIERRVLRNVTLIFGLGFFASAAALAFGAPLLLFFRLLALVVLLTSLTYWGSFAWYYERG